jgi:hypothetical protein
MGGRYIDDGQYDHHVWLYRILQLLQMDAQCYGTCFALHHTPTDFERIPPEEVFVHDR